MGFLLRHSAHDSKLFFLEISAVVQNIFLSIVQLRVVSTLHSGFSLDTQYGMCLLYVNVTTRRRSSRATTGDVQ
ncbi:hypothetical protein DM02DRAFT_620597, partial [Periconia macrospinosa]